MSYSVLMSVYHKEKPEYFSAALDSLWGQTEPTDDFVLVCDGPLTKELDEVVDEHQKAHAELHVLRLEKNQGLGPALAQGLLLCKNDIVLRADSDDINVADRAKQQVKMLTEEGLDLISSDVDLFVDDPSQPFAKRTLPYEAKQIRKYSKKRSPFNHPSVAFRKQSVLDAGNYQPLLFKEDYYLWVRMLQHGAKAKNTPVVLVHMRENSGTLTRRSSKDAYRAQKTLLEYMLESRYINRLEYCRFKTLYWIQSILPLWMMKLTYRFLLRKSVRNS